MRSMVEGARAVTIFLRRKWSDESDAPSTILRAPRYGWSPSPVCTGEDALYPSGTVGGVSPLPGGSSARLALSQGDKANSGDQASHGSMLICAARAQNANGLAPSQKSPNAANDGIACR